MNNITKIVPIHNPKEEGFNVQLINQLLNDELEIDGKKPNKYKSEQIEILIVTGNKTLKEVYQKALRKGEFKSRNDKLTMNLDNDNAFIIITDKSKPPDLGTIISSKRNYILKELHIIIFVNDKGQLILDGNPADPKVLETIIQVDNSGEEVQQLSCQEEGAGKKSSPKKKSASSKGMEHYYGVLETIHNGERVKVNNTANNWKEGWCIGQCKPDPKSKLNYCTTKKQCVQDQSKPRGQDCRNRPTKFGICEKRIVYKEGEDVDIPTIDFSNSYLEELAKKHKPPFDIKDNPGGGNCFFYAIADSLKTLPQANLTAYVGYFNSVKPELGASFEKIITQPDSYKYVKEFYIMWLKNNIDKSIYFYHAILLAMELNPNDSDSTLSDLATLYKDKKHIKKLILIGTGIYEQKKIKFTDNSFLSRVEKGFCHNLNEKYFKDYLEKESNWGGNMEAFILSLIIRIPIDIYEVDPSGSEPILSTKKADTYAETHRKFGDSIPELKTTIDNGKRIRLSIILDRSHYQSLQPITAKTGAKKKKSLKRKLIDLSHIVNKNMSKKKKVVKKKKQKKQEKKKKNKKKTKKSK